MLKAIGYFNALLNYAYKYYLQIKHYPKLKIEGRPLIGKRVRFILATGSKTSIGKGVMISDDVIIQAWSGAQITIGKKCFFNRTVSLIVHEKLEIGNEVMLGENVKVYDNEHVINGNKVERKLFNTAPVIIRDNCWIANSAVVLKGTTMGPNTLVAALTMASGNLEANAMYMGVPCRKLKKLETEESK